MNATTEATYRYLGASAVLTGDGETRLRLSTSDHGGHPSFFTGFVEHPEQTAVALLAVARIARTRFWTPPGTVAAAISAADPVVTSNGDRLRFESFSVCCGAYARLDLLPDGLDRPPLTTGTTNVDINPPLRESLARLAGAHPLHLAVGADGLTVTTLDGSVVERRVPLPDRWVKGFAEVALDSSTMTPRITLTGTQARAFVHSLPRSDVGGRAPAWVVPSPRGARLTPRPTDADTVCLAGPERLRALEPLLRFAVRLTGYGPDPHAAVSTRAPLPSAWELTLPGARVTLLLSPELSRGFSGEGAVLAVLSDSRAAQDADLVSALLAFEPVLEPAALAASSGLPEHQVQDALTVLAAVGRIGHDLATDAYFHRELPHRPRDPAHLHPRLRAARELQATGCVIPGHDATTVISADTHYLVRHTPDGDRCSCTWWGRHRGDRGPCKHVLAATLARRHSQSPS